MAKKVALLQGNEACAHGAVYAGCKFFGGYPITPSTEVAEVLSNELPKVGGKFIQMEDEIGAMAAVIGASLTGAKAITATSGPGISLMQEFIGLAYFAEIPAVIFDVQRGGPSTGMPTRTQQSDLLICAYASHGDTKHVLLFPADPNECFTFAATSFDLADRLQVLDYGRTISVGTPAEVLADRQVINAYLGVPGS